MPCQCGLNQALICQLQVLSMMTTQHSIDHLLDGPLNRSDVEHFLTNGFVKIVAAFDAGQGSIVERWIDESWLVMGLDITNSSTWPEQVTRVTSTATVFVHEFAPRVHAALAQLMGGADNVVDPYVYGGRAGHGRDLTWSNEFLVNYRWGADRQWIAPGPDAPGWHVDGNWFQHYLDSPEQGLLLIVCWGEMVHQAGATFIAPDSIGPVARFLGNHPEGVAPDGFPISDILSQCRDYREVQAAAGDVFLIHPFMMHASSYNVRQQPRFMTNPAVSRAHPMTFDRRDGRYDAMELAILQALGVDHLDFRIAGQRRQFHP